MMRVELCRQCCTLRRKSLCVYFLVSCVLFTSFLLFAKPAFSPLNLTNPLTSKLSLSDVIKRQHDVTRTSGSINVISGCRNVFPDMLHGRWVPKKNVSDARRREMKDYLLQIRGEYRIPRTLQRPDGKCGNLPYEGVPLYRHMWFRALCDPQGPTPCCYDFQCSPHSVENCRCPHCLDTRTPVHAELSDWLPARPECRLREFYANEACGLLRGTRLILAGDSFVRHVFVALVMLLTNDFQDGALKENADLATRFICRGMFQINGLRCRDILEQERTLCNGTVTLTYLEVFQVSRGRFLLPYLQKETSRHQKVLLLLGVGIHDDFRTDFVWSLFLQPLVEYVTNTVSPSSAKATAASFGSLTTPSNSSKQTDPKNISPSPPSSASSPRKDKASDEKLPFLGQKRKWPKMIWANTHAPGLLKSPLFPAQSYEGVKFFNGRIADFLQPYGIPVLDSFNMTAPVHSVEGTHYGYGVNHLKVQFLLNWVKERQDRGDW